MALSVIDGSCRRCTDAIRKDASEFRSLQSRMAPSASTWKNAVTRSRQRSANVEYFPSAHRLQSADHCAVLQSRIQYDESTDILDGRRSCRSVSGVPGDDPISREIQRLSSIGIIHYLEVRSSARQHKTLP